jgi:hypothetical protein
MPAEKGSSRGSAKPSRSESEQEADFLESICLPCAKKAKAAGMDVVVSYHRDGRREIRFTSTSSESKGEGGDVVDAGATASGLRAEYDERNGASAKVISPETINPSRIPRLNVAVAVASENRAAENKCRSNEALPGPALKAPSAAVTGSHSTPGAGAAAAATTGDGTTSVDQDRVDERSPTYHHKTTIAAVPSGVSRSSTPEDASPEAGRGEEKTRSVSIPRCGVCYKNFDKNLDLLSSRAYTTVTGQHRLPLSCQGCSGLVCYCCASTAMVNKLYGAEKRTAIKSLTWLACPLCKKEYGFYFGNEPIITHPERFSDLDLDHFDGLRKRIQGRARESSRERPESLAVNRPVVDFLVGLNAPPPSDSEDDEAFAPAAEPRHPGQLLLATDYRRSIGSMATTDSSSLSFSDLALRDERIADRLKIREPEASSGNRKPAYATESSNVLDCAARPSVVARPVCLQMDAFRMAAEPGPGLFFDAAKCADTLTIISDDGADGPSVRSKVSNIWGTVLATHPFSPLSGVHRFAVRLDHCELKNVFVGISTEQANLRSYLGRDEHSWGMIGIPLLYHNKRRVS